MKKEIIAFFKKNPTSLLKARQLGKELYLTESHEYDELKSQLFALYSEGFLEREGKKFRLAYADASDAIIGELQINPSGFGFVLVKNSQMPDIFIAARNLGTSFHGDIVECALFARQKKNREAKRLEGQIVRIVERKVTEISGILKKSRSFFYVEPDLPNFLLDIYVPAEALLHARLGDKVIVGSIVWDDPDLNPEGRIVEVLGKAGSHDVELLSLAKELKIPYKFSKEVLQEADKINTAIPQEEIAKRVDYRDKVVFTIDPDDAKDFDDALSIVPLENGNFSIGIHIADVSHYVPVSSKLDQEALLRGNSVYLVGKVIPMLPERLSNGVCSLSSNEDKLTFSVIVEITPRGRVAEYSIAKTIIRSTRRFSYEEAQRVLDTESGDCVDQLLALNKLARVLRKKRMNEGSINFITPEIKFELDKEGKPIGVSKKIMQESNYLVEEFMLLANRIVAHHVEPKTAADFRPPFLYRIHDKPDPEKLREFELFLKSLGHSFSFDGPGSGKAFNKLLEHIKGEPEEGIINELSIRTMAKAVYSADNIGHYGLHFPHYTHFTSPIRRYSDLLVHRVLLTLSEEKKKVLYAKDRMEEMCAHISDTERLAMDAERTSVRKKFIEYMQPFIGDTFNAIISGVTNFGIFVKLVDTLAEGLIHVRELSGDTYFYDEKKYALTGARSGRSYRLGDKVTARLIRIDSRKSLLDFELVD